MLPAQVPNDLLASFPLGWQGEDPFGRDGDTPNWGLRGWIAHLIIGWLYPAAAVSLGAPIWFDLLTSVAKLRGTGRGPGSSGSLLFPSAVASGQAIALAILRHWSVGCSSVRIPSATMTSLSISYSS